MQRYHTLLAGASWMAEYGDPDTDEWEFLQKYSPYHSKKSWKLVSDTRVASERNVWLMTFLFRYNDTVQTLIPMLTILQSLSQHRLVTTAYTLGMLASL